MCAFRVIAWSQFQIRRKDWFSSGLLCGMSPLYGWDARTLSRLGEGTQSWSFCPLISLGMLQLETTLNTTGPRASTGLGR